MSNAELAELSLKLGVDIERLTLIEKRNRLAWDMHDTIGHTFITTITALNAVNYLLRQDPVEAAKSVDEPACSHA